MRARRAFVVQMSSRAAFQSIEAVVMAFNGVSMMMGSTYEALAMSFRAVIGIVDQFGRMQGTFSDMWAPRALVACWVRNRDVSS